MTLHKKTYKAFDAVRLVFQVSPVYIVLRTLLTITQATVLTAATALTTANFVDTATDILQGQRPRTDIYAPLVLLLVMLGLAVCIDSVSRLVNWRNHLNIRRKLEPALVKLRATLDFKHIENAESWELMSRVCRDAQDSIMNGYNAYLLLLRILVSIVSVMVLIVTQVWWAAIIIVIFSTPMFWLSTRAGKKKFQAGREAENFRRRSEYLGEVLSGRDAVDERALFGYGDAVNRRWHEQYEAGRLHQLKVAIKMVLLTNASSMVLALISLLVALTLIGSVVAGDLSAGMFMGIVSAVFGMIYMMGWPMSWSLEQISVTGEYMKDWTAFVAMSGSEDLLSEPDAEPLIFESLEFCNVSFKYPSGDRLIWDGLSFKLEAGRHYAFVGKNGAGKTTITKLLLDCTPNMMARY